MTLLIKQLSKSAKIMISFIPLRGIGSVMNQDQNVFLRTIISTSALLLIVSGCSEHDDVSLSTPMNVATVESGDLETETTGQVIAQDPSTSELSENSSARLEQIDDEILALEESILAQKQSIAKQATEIEAKEKELARREASVQDLLKESVEDLKQLAESGVVAAMVALADQYERGVGATLPVNLQESFRWRLRAAESNHLESMIRVANDYDHGNVVPNNEATAFQWYKEAAGQGSESGAVHVAIIYLFGNLGQKQNTELAIKVLIPSAQAGNLDAVTLLSLAYLHPGPTKNFEESIKWYRAASKAGFGSKPRALNDFVSPLLGGMMLGSYLDGELPFDSPIAREYFCEGSRVTRKFAASGPSEISEIPRDLVKSACYPSPSGEWKVVDRNSNAEMVKKLLATLEENGIAPPKGFNAVIDRKEVFVNPRISTKRLDLLCYSNVSLWHLTCQEREEVRDYLIVVAKDKPRLLNGLSSVIHELNRLAPLQLDSLPAAQQYLELFCLATQADDGVYLIVESADSLHWHWNASEKLISEIMDKFVPSKLERDEAGSWSGQATVQYGDSLFVSGFKVDPNGKVDMVSDTPIATDLPLFAQKFIDGQKIIVDPVQSDDN